MRSSFPVIFSGTGYIPPASAVNYVTWGIVGFIFQYLIRRRNFSWWTKYNCMYHFDLQIIHAHLFLVLHTDVLSAALDTGLACSIILIFFCLQYPQNGAIGANNVLTWWGNTVFLKTADGLATPLRVVNGTFG
jgi:hypothetical protein